MDVEISMYHLVWVVPLAVGVGMYLAALFGANDDHK